MDFTTKLPQKRETKRPIRLNDVKVCNWNGVQITTWSLVLTEKGGEQTQLSGMMKRLEYKSSKLFKTQFGNNKEREEARH